MEVSTTILERFANAAIRWPERPFLVAASKPSLDHLSYATVMFRARRFASLLRDAGVQSGDRVILNCPNSVEYLCAYFGVWLVGGIVVPLDPRSRPAHVDRVCSDCDARCIVIPEHGGHVKNGVFSLALNDVDWRSDHDSGPFPNLGSDSLALIIYTSGTTGTPRGVCLSHGNLEHTRASIISWAGVTEDDRELTTLSLTHLFGLAHVHVYGSIGATMYIHEGLKDIPALLETIERAEISSFPATPAGIKILIDKFSDLLRHKARRLRYMVINTAAMPEDYTRRLLALLPNTKVFMYYGLTEASRSTYIAYRDHPDKLASVGRPTPGAEVCIGSPVHRLINEPGEILVKGPHVMSRYWGLDSSEYFDHEWFRTGDLGIVDGDGFVTWLGRVREQININGLKLVPAEVEDVIRADPRVKECAVVGAPDPATGEAVIAFVVPAEPVDARFELMIRRLCSKQLEDYKVPKRVVVVDEIPKTDSGKIKRFLLRERWVARAN